MDKENNNYFSTVVESYKISYLRTCEEWLIKKYFKGNVLILGCGAGRTIKPLVEKGFKVTAIDLNPDMVREAQKSNPEVTVLQMNASSLQFEDNSFDTVFFPFHGINYVYPDIYKAVREAQRVLRPNGVFVTSSYNRFFVKDLSKFFEGNYSYNKSADLFTYRSTPLDWFRLKRYFKKVRMIQRISIAISWKDANWKDMLYKIFSLFNKSTYFVCWNKK